MENFKNVLTNFDKLLRGIKICIYSYFDLKKLKWWLVVFPSTIPSMKMEKFKKGSHIMEYAK